MKSITFAVLVLLPVASFAADAPAITADGEKLHVQAQEMLLSLGGNDPVSMTELIAQINTMASEMMGMKTALAVSFT
jgi:hypothetical protein